MAITATDLAEIVGSATAMYLLFGLPLWIGVLITAVDVLFILFFGTRNFRLLEVSAFLVLLRWGPLFCFILFTLDATEYHKLAVECSAWFLPSSIAYFWDLLIACDVLQLMVSSHPLLD